MKNALFVGLWVLLLIGVVLIATALGIVGGPAAVCGFLGVAIVFAATAVIYVLHTSGDVVEEEIVE